MNTDDQPWRYHRHGDPDTSRRAAERVTTKITDRHLHALGALLDLDKATDDMVADRLVRDGVVERHEQGRRLMRTLRDRYGYVAPVIVDGQQAIMVNDSGREALVWTLSMHGIQIAVDPSARSIR